METIRDFFASLGAYLKERLANPLYVCYVAAWCILNFRLLLVLSGDQTPAEKISHIDKLLYTEWWHWAWFGFGYPLLVAVAFVVASPFVHRWVSWYLKGREKRTIEGLLKIADETPLPKPAADRLRESLISERRRRLEEAQLATERLDEVEAQLEIAIRQKKELEARLLEGLKPSTENPADPYAGDDAPDISGGQSNHAGTEVASGKEDADDLKAVLPLSEEDFYGLPPTISLPLVKRGLTVEQARALHHVRNSQDFGLKALASRFPNKELYEMQVLADQLTGLRLMGYSSATGTYSVTSAGRQALDAVVKRGFKAG